MKNNESSNNITSPEENSFKDAKDNTAADAEKPAKSRFRLWARIIALVLVLALVGDLALRTAAFGRMSVSFSRSGGAVGVNGSVLSGSVSGKRPLFLRARIQAAYDKFTKAVKAENWEDAVAPAEDLYENMEDNKSAGPYLRQVLAQLYYLTGRYDKCAETCESIISRGEEQQGSYAFMKGIALMQDAQWETAEEALNKALETGLSERPSERTVCKLQILSCEYNMRKYENTAKLGQELLAEDDAAKASSGKTEPRGGEDSGIIGAVLSESERTSVETLTAVSMLQTERYAESEKLLTTLIEKTRSGEYYYYRGVARMSLKNYSGGVKDLEAAISHGLEDPDYLSSAKDILAAVAHI